MDGLIQRQQIIDILRSYITEPDISDDEIEIKGFNDGLEKAISIISMLPIIKSEQTIKVVEHDASIIMDGYKYLRSEYLCDNCKKRVLPGDDYCSHCGIELNWGDNE